MGEIMRFEYALCSSLQGVNRWAVYAPLQHTGRPLTGIAHARRPCGVRVCACHARMSDIRGT